MWSQSADSGVSYTVTSVGVESRSRCYGVTSEVVTMSLAARCKCRSRIPRRGAPAEFGVGEDRTVEVRLAEVRLLVHFATLVCYFATFIYHSFARNAS